MDLVEKVDGNTTLDMISGYGIFLRVFGSSNFIFLSDFAQDSLNILFYILIFNHFTYLSSIDILNCYTDNEVP